MRTIILCLSMCYAIIAQSQDFIELAPMPERVANNAVTQATVNGDFYVYSFTGIDSTKSCDGDHLKVWRYSVNADEWETLPDIEDALGGKIAAGASTVKNKIYVIGGYHLSPNCFELSSEKMHIFDPETNEWQANGAPIPTAIDDHVQAVWRDSLIFVITGWSNTTNVNKVQIYNPSTDEWQAGTSTPNINSSAYKVFGGSGVIIGDTIYYAGGARVGNNFPATTTFRKGYINPDNPTEIEWVSETTELARGYRMGAAVFNNKAIWLGGSDVTYNFDGIAYNSSGGVSPVNRITAFDPNTGVMKAFFDLMPTVMDLRGVAQIADNQFIIAGGMEENQEVTNKTWLITLDDLPTKISEKTLPEIAISPNPASDFLQVQKEGNYTLHLVDVHGKIVLKQAIFGNEPIDVSSLNSGLFVAQIYVNEVLENVGTVVIF